MNIYRAALGMAIAFMLAFLPISPGISALDIEEEALLQATEEEAADPGEETEEAAEPAGEAVQEEEVAEDAAEPAGEVAEEEEVAEDAAEPDGEAAQEEEVAEDAIDEGVSEPPAPTVAEQGPQVPPVGIASASLAEGIANLAAMLAAGFPPSTGERVVAVADFRNLDGEFNDLGRFLSERLTSRFSLMEGLQAVDRRRFMDVLDARGFFVSALNDPALARQLGDAVGADLIVIGTISELEDRVELDARTMDLRAGGLLPAAFTHLPKDEQVGRLLAHGRRDESGRPLSEPEEPEEKFVDQPRFENETFRLSVEAVRKSERAISIIISYENLTAEPVNLLFRRTAYLIDDRGDRWDQDVVDTARIWVHCCGTGIELIPGTRRRTRLDFTTRDSGEGNTFTLIGKQIAPGPERTLIIDGILLGKAKKR